MSDDAWGESPPFDGAPPIQDEQAPNMLVGDASTWHREAADRACELIAAVPGVHLDREGALIMVEDRQQSTPKIRAIGAQQVPDLLGRADVVVMQRTAKGQTPCDPPGVLCQTVISRRTESAPWRIFDGFASGPYLLPGGDVVQAQGYHAERRLWLPHAGACELRSTGKGALKARGFTSQDEAVAAARWVVSELREFPWADAELDPAIWLGYVLTLITRPGYETVPLFLFEASRPRSGKDLLLKIAETLAHGRTAARVTLVENPDENEKRIGTALLDGHTTLIFGDVKQLGSPLLLSMITEGSSVIIRALGGNQRIPVPRTMTLGATANNVTLPLPDLVARTIALRLDPSTEAPELTPHAKDQDELLAWYRDRRAPILAALFNLLRAYQHRTKHPETEPRGLPCGTFPTWSRTVRDPLLWLGFPDLLASQARLKLQTPIGDGAASLALVSAWWALFRDQTVTSGRLIQIAASTEVSEEQDDGGFSQRTDPDRVKLADAMKEIDDKMNAKRLGKHLASLRDGIFALDQGRVKLIARTEHNQQTYRLIQLS